MRQIDIFWYKKKESFRLGLEGPNPKISNQLSGQKNLVVKKSVKFGAKYHEMGKHFKTSYLGLGMNFFDIFRA